MKIDVKSGNEDICFLKDAKDVDIVVEENSKLTLNLDEPDTAELNLQASVKGLFILNISRAKEAKEKIIINLEKENAEIVLTEAIIGKGKNKFESDLVIVHKVPKTKSDVLVKGILNDATTATYNGKIIIEKDAAKSDANLNQHFLLLSEDAVAQPVPILEILNNDVAASHSASVSHMDKEHLFYVRSRGLEDEDAENLLAEGFVLAALNRMEDGR